MKILMLAGLLALLSSASAQSLTSRTVFNVGAFPCDGQIRMVHESNNAAPVRIFALQVYQQTVAHRGAVTMRGTVTRQSDGAVLISEPWVKPDEAVRNTRFVSFTPAFFALDRGDALVFSTTCLGRDPTVEYIQSVLAFFSL